MPPEYHISQAATPAFYYGFAANRAAKSAHFDPVISHSQEMLTPA
jgi:hypothetical protein